ncbi:MAG: DUF4124 domain-containing protein [Xanthomonadales bacterium]|nr:DUF4124 domain-containing protein [Xanthomonadales bacterium]
MKLITNKELLMVLLTFSLVMTASSLMAQVYKIVDENGNVTFTDIPPGDGSKPMDLPAISVVETPDYETTARQAAEAAAASGDAEPPEETLRSLRESYRDFEIISPRSEESIWSPDGPVSVTWSVGSDLREGMQVMVFIDGNLRATTAQPMIPIVGLERGEHIVTAEIRDRRNRTIVAAQPITFFVRQPNLYNRARRGPRGGS